MNAQNLVRPIRSSRRFRLGESEISPGPIRPVSLLKEILRPGEGNQRRCAANVVVYGGHDRPADEFAAAALACLEPLDSLWRVGFGESPDHRVIWLDEDQPVLGMLNARVAFIPADEHHHGLFAKWQNRADAIFFGGREGFSTSLPIDLPDRMWQWGAASVWVTDVRSRPSLHLATPARMEPIPVAYVSVGHARLQPLEVGTTFSQFQFEGWSQDLRVSATVQGGRGGDLTVLFMSTDPLLEGARIRFQFRTTDGGLLRGEKQLWKDESDPQRFVASWQGNQLDMDRPQPAESEAAAEIVHLAFEFEVLPPE